jgi:hypothetical protein
LTTNRKLVGNAPGVLPFRAVMAFVVGIQELVTARFAEALKIELENGR